MIVENSRTCARCGNRSRAAAVGHGRETTVGACSVCGYGAGERVRRNSPSRTAAKIKAAVFEQINWTERSGGG